MAGPKELTKLRKNVAADPDQCGWSTFIEKSVQPWLVHPVITEPGLYSDKKRTPATWHQTYIDCQELIYVVRHLTIARHVTRNPQMLPHRRIPKARHRAWGLAWGYDWLHAKLMDGEYTFVRGALVARTRQVADQVISYVKIQLFPYDSHAVRSVSALLVPACIAILGEEKACALLDYSFGFLFTIYAPWGDADGGWAESHHCWLT